MEVTKSVNLSFLIWSCCIVLDILRKNKQTLITFIKSFLSDIFVDWNKSKKHGENNLSIEKRTTQRRIYEDANLTLGRITNLLNGCLGNEKSVISSVEAQVAQTIQDATSDKLLSQMFKGWTPWI